MRLIADVITYAFHQIPKWNPINICSYHLQEAGCDPRRRSPTPCARRSRCSTGQGVGRDG